MALCAPSFPQGVLWLELKPVCLMDHWYVRGKDKGLVLGRCWSCCGLGCPITGLKQAREAGP